MLVVEGGIDQVQRFAALLTLQSLPPLFPFRAPVPCPLPGPLPPAALAFGLRLRRARPRRNRPCRTVLPDAFAGFFDRWRLGRRRRLHRRGAAGHPGDLHPAARSPRRNSSGSGLAPRVPAGQRDLLRRAGGQRGPRRRRRDPDRAAPAGAPRGWPRDRLLAGEGETQSSSPAAPGDRCWSASARRRSPCRSRVRSAYSTRRAAARSAPSGPRWAGRRRRWPGCARSPPRSPRSPRPARGGHPGLDPPAPGRRARGCGSGENGNASVAADQGRIVVPGVGERGRVDAGPAAGDTGTAATIPAASASVRATSAVVGPVARGAWPGSGRPARPPRRAAPRTGGIGSGSWYMCARSIWVVVLACHGSRPVSIR